jgi:ribonuclease HI
MALKAYKTNSYDEFATVFTDASFGHASGVAGYGGVVLSGSSARNYFGYIREPCVSSNDAELWAVYYTLVQAKADGLFNGRRFLSVQCDNLHALSELNKLPHTQATWAAPFSSRVRANVKTNEHNAEAIKAIADVIEGLFTKVYLKHIKAHTRKCGGREGLNETCDQMAKRGRALGEKTRG